MSSIKSFFNYDDLDYEATITNKFTDNFYQLILNGNLKKVKEFVCNALIEIENEKQDDPYEFRFSPNHADSTFSADDYNIDDEYFKYENSQESENECKLLEIGFSNGFTPLMLSAHKGFPELVEYFISLKFNVNKVNKKTGISALLSASNSVSDDVNPQKHFENVTRCIRLLVEAGANIKATLINNEHSALHLVVIQNNIPSCKYFVDKVDVNCKDSKQCTPLMIAASKGFVEIIQLLLDAGADLNLRNIHGFSAVELGMINNQSDAVKMLIRPTDNLDFYRAWSVVFKDLVDTEKTQNIKESFVKKFYSSKYFSDQIACMCASLNLTHLQHILEKNGITFSVLRTMSDEEMKNIGITKFSERKSLLNLMQDVHKVSWVHQTSLYTPNYKLSITPIDMLDVVKNVHQHLEFLESSMKYIEHHILTNPSYYSNYLQNKSFFENCVSHCQFSELKANNILETTVQIDTIFDKMYDCALDEDMSGQLNDEEEEIVQHRLTKKFSGIMKTGIILSGLSLIGFVLVRSRILNV